MEYFTCFVVVVIVVIIPFVFLQEWSEIDGSGNLSELTQFCMACTKEFNAINSGQRRSIVKSKHQSTAVWFSQVFDRAWLEVLKVTTAMLFEWRNGI